MEYSFPEETPKRRSNASSSSSSSPEFEFWMVNNPNSPQPNLLTADELFSNGFLLPLLPSRNFNPHPDSSPSPDLSPPPVSTPSCTPPSGKSWKDIFKSLGEGEKRSAAELNINLWPFSRSRSARAGAAALGRPKAGTARKASSAPCSRSNSRGESSKPTTTTIESPPSKKPAPSPGRLMLSGGIRLGRTGPVWQLRRSSKTTGPKEAAKEGKEKGSHEKKGVRVGAAKVLSLNVNTCIGHRSQVRCNGADNTEGDRSENGALFSLKALLSKKVY